MKHLYFKPEGTLWVITKNFDPKLAEQFPNPLVVEDDFDTTTQDESVEVEEGMPTARREMMRSKIEALLSYATKRKAEYPPIEDYLDGVVKNDQSQIKAYIAACLAVKAKYPKV
jgi:hypothetical protein